MLVSNGTLSIHPGSILQHTGDTDNVPLDTEMSWIQLLLIIFIVSVETMVRNLFNFYPIFPGFNSDPFSLYITDNSMDARFLNINPMAYFIKNTCMQALY